MPTDDERREVARRLRDEAAHGEMHIRDFLGALCACIKTGRNAYRALLRLAYLIEPEQERTCHMTKIGGDRILAGWWECSECGPVYPPCKDEIAKWALQKCPRCGAKIVGE